MKEFSQLKFCKQLGHTHGGMSSVRLRVLVLVYALITQFKCHSDVHVAWVTSSKCTDVYQRESVLKVHCHQAIT